MNVPFSFTAIFCFKVFYFYIPFVLKLGGDLGKQHCEAVK